MIRTDEVDYTEVLGLSSPVRATESVHCRVTIPGRRIRSFGVRRHRAAQFTCHVARPGGGNTYPNPLTLLQGAGKTAAHLLVRSTPHRPAEP